MIKKIVILSVSFVIGFIAIFFSVHASAFTGRGKGKNKTVKNPEELAELIENLPKSGKLTAKAGDVNGDGSGDGQNGLTPLTLHDVMYECIQTEEREVLSASGFRSSTYTKKTDVFRREMDIYFTADAVYYDLDFVVSESSDCEYSESIGNATESETTHNTNCLEMCFDYCLTANKTFIKYKKYNILSEKVRLVDGEEVDQDEEESEETQSALFREEMIKAIRKNYGKWIEFSYDPQIDLDKLETDNLTTKQQIEISVKYLCGLLSNELHTDAREVTDTNVSTIQNIGNHLNNYQDEDRFTKSGNIYAMTDSEFRSFVCTLPGFDAQEITGGAFAVNLNNKAAPQIFLDVSSIHSGPDSEKTFNATHQESIEFTNINNTIIPSVPKSAKNLYDFLGRTFKRLLTDDKVLRGE